MFSVDEGSDGVTGVNFSVSHSGTTNPVAVISRMWATGGGSFEATGGDDAGGAVNISLFSSALENNNTCYVKIEGLIDVVDTASTFTLNVNRTGSGTLNVNNGSYWGVL